MCRLRLTLLSFSTFGTLYVAIVAIVKGLTTFDVREKGRIDVEAIGLHDTLPSRDMLLAAIDRKRWRERENSSHFEHFLTELLYRF